MAMTMTMTMAMAAARTSLLPLLLLLSTVVFLNVSLWLYTNNTERHLRQHLKQSQKTPSVDTEYRIPLLVIFTCFTREQGKAYIQTNTLRNWALFRPMVQPILYTVYEEGPLNEFAKHLGWDVIPAPNISSIGVPYLKNMYFAAMKTHKSVLYGYANGDILFTDGFVDTLREVVRNSNALKTTMIIGRRTNFKINITNLSPIYRTSDVFKLSHKGRLFSSDAEDYFFVTTDFPWSIIPDLVIGRKAYDNFLVGTAIKRNISVVDATKTIIALHQTGADGNWAGQKHHDADFNKNLIKKIAGRFNYNGGITTLAPYECNRDFIGKVFLKKRQFNPPMSTK